MAELQEEPSRGESEAKLSFLGFFYQSPVEEESSEFQPQTEKLPMVPKVLRDDESIKECFEPKLVSIGPYHHHNPKLKPMECLKKNMARLFVKACKCPAYELYCKLFKEIKQIRDLYEKKTTDKYNDEAFTQILFVDGCFILYFIHCILRGGFDHHLNFKNYHIVGVMADSFVLENQLPFLVLKLLEENFKIRPSMIEEYIELMGNCFIPIKGGWKKYSLQPKDSTHFVQLLHRGLDHSYDVKMDVSCSGSILPFAVTEYGKRVDILPPSYSVTELAGVGIYCKPSPTGGFRCSRFRGHWFHGVLELPSMAVGVRTRSNLFNMIAYEMHPDVRDLHILSYIHFLASLLRQPQDVKALREARILHNYFDSDEKVMNLFGEIASKSPPEVMSIDVLKQIAYYLDKRGKTMIASWLAEVIRVYFRSPWTTITVLAGFLALSATIIQTVFTVLSNYKLQAH